MIQDLASHYHDKTVAVTGSRGYLASALIQLLAGTAKHVIAVSRHDSSPGFGLEPITADVRTKECWTEIVARADIIFHLAGNTSVSEAARDSAGSLQSTVLPVIHLAAAAQQGQRRPRVVYASTATVYGLTDRLPVDENTETRPQTTYDLHKLFAEQQLELASYQGVLDGVSLRLSNVYGPSPSTTSAAERGVLNKVTIQALRGAELSLYGDGNYLRDYVYVEDVVRAFLMTAVQPGMSGSTFNVGTGTGVTVREAFHVVVERAAKVSGRRSLIKNAPWPDDTHRIDRRDFTASIDRLTAACGWVPTVSLTEGIDRLIGHLVNAPATVAYDEY